MERRIAIVTGANRGIGYEIATQLLSAGLDVVVTAREIVEGERAAREIGARSHRLDVSDPESIASLAGDFEEGIDVLVNNAGASFSGFDAEVAQRTMQVNFFGALELTRQLLPTMHDGARIVMVSSGMGTLDHVGPPLRARFEDPALDQEGVIALAEEFIDDVANGTHADRGWPSNAYSVSKVALNALTRVLARELASDPRRILVNAACPGWVRTRMGGSSAPRSPERGARTPAWLALLPDGGPSGGFFRDERPIAF